MKSRSCAIAAGITVVVIGLVITVAALLCNAYRVSNTVPVIKTPRMTMPSPNAFDYFVKAGKQLDVPKDFDPRTCSSIEQAAILKKNRTALETLRSGLGYSYMHPLKYGIDATYPEYSQFRTIARLLAAESQTRAGVGDWARAIGICLDGMMMGEQSVHGGGLMGMYVGTSMQHICREEAWRAIDQLTPAQARYAIARLNAISLRHLPVHRTLQEEKLLGSLGLQDLLSGKCKDSEYKSLPELPNRIKRKTLIRYGEFMDESIRTVRRPYADKPPIPEMERCNNPLLFAWEGPVNVILTLWCLPCDGLWLSDLRCQTQNRLLQTSLALRAYRVEKGAYPDKLTDLVPTYLHSLPKDLFATRGTFGYRREGNRYVLWSVGPDSKNDQGKPISKGPIGHSKAPPTDAFVSRAESKGDIVASINDR